MIVVECPSEMLYFLVFFFQAEDGIRDLTVTGVQTCALPISVRPRLVSSGATSWPRRFAGGMYCMSEVLVVDGLVGGVAVRLVAAGDGAQVAEIGRASCRGRG